MQDEILTDAVRAILGRDLTKCESRQILAAIAELCVPSRTKSTLAGKRSVSGRGVALIKQFEGCARQTSDGRFAAYPDPGTGGAPWTIGWGATGPDVRRGDIWTQRQCDDRLLDDIARHAKDVDCALGKAITTQNQFDAMVSFHYNTGAIGRATLTRRHKAGDFAEAQRQFARWNRAGGRVMRGLVRRRSAEAQLYAE